MAQVLSRITVKTGFTTHVLVHDTTAVQNTSISVPGKMQYNENTCNYYSA